MSFLLLLIRIIVESCRQAFIQLWSNKLRTTLSLLGITIGIWCVIMVFSAVDSLEANIKNSFNKLGDDVVYISTMPWGEDPRENFWKYMRRPQPSFSDFQMINKKSKTARFATFTVFIGSKNVEYTKTNASNVFLIGVTKKYNEMFGLQFEQGRYFNQTEFDDGSSKLILGFEVATTLFPEGNSIGKYVKIKGHKFQIIGVLEKTGKDLINPLNFDDAAIIPYTTTQKYVNLRKVQFSQGRTSLSVKAKEGVDMENMNAELTSLLRAKRRLKPKEENNFEMNSLSILSNIFDNIFGVIRIAGLFIGIFAMLVGGFSVANIMFVSVKERTKLIGIKKALGAKQFVILLEFLIESIILCIIGGIIGLLLVIMASYFATTWFEYEIFLSVNNAIWGLLISTLAGVISGIVPAYQASKMVPVEAIRS